MTVDHAASASDSPARPRPGVLQGQFALPQGLLGRLVGWWMAHENERMNRLAVKTLDVQSRDDVLEIGFGPGQAIELLVQRTAADYIAGVDPSEVMLDEARRRNSEAVDAGRVELAQATVEDLPFGDGRFSKVFAVSNFGIWNSPERGLREIKRVLRDDGLLLMCLRRSVRRKYPWTSPGISARELESDKQLLVDHGFRNVHVMQRHLDRRIACLLANK
jgi:SAM-dependent methyltransferase